MEGVKAKSKDLRNLMVPDEESEGNGRWSSGV